MIYQFREKYRISEMIKEQNIFIIYIKLATVVEGDTKALFLLGTTPSCRGRRNIYPWIAPLYPWYIPFNGEC